MTDDATGDPLAAQTAQLEALRLASLALDPDPGERAALAAAALAHVEAYLGVLETALTYRAPAEGLATPSLPFPPTGRPMSEALAFLKTAVDAPGIATASPRFAGYVPGGGLFHAALADFIAAGVNKYAGFASAAPGAARLENQTVRWLADAVGYPDEALGVLTSGGSIATLTALVAARDAAGASGPGALYLTDFTHHCVDKALHVIGCGGLPTRRVATDARTRMDVEALAEAVRRDRAQGVRPWLVVASAGATDTGAVDPLNAIADLCEAEGIWLHVDGAYGGLFRLCPEASDVLAGIDRADTLVLDPHKTLFLPYGVGAVLARDGARLLRSFSADAQYMQRLDDLGAGPSPADLGPELTRHFRALRLWLPLQLAGVDAFRAALSEKIGLARHMHARLTATPGFEVLAPPDLSILAWRYRPESGDINAFNSSLSARLRQEGRVFLSDTRIGGDVWLRCAILSFRTHFREVEEMLSAVTAAARAVAVC